MIRKLLIGIYKKSLGKNLLIAMLIGIYKKSLGTNLLIAIGYSRLWLIKRLDTASLYIGSWYVWIIWYQTYHQWYLIILSVLCVIDLLYKTSLIVLMECCEYVPNVFSFFLTLFRMEGAGGRGCQKGPSLPVFPL